jgi:hypothetical protein
MRAWTESGTVPKRATFSRVLASAHHAGVRSISG